MNGFKVVIDVDTKGKKVLPSMTTSNNILIASYKDDVIVPREAVFGKDTTHYVFVKNRSSIDKVLVKVGGENKTHIRIVQGLDAGDEILLSCPEEFQKELDQESTF